MLACTDAQRISRRVCQGLGGKGPPFSHLPAGAEPEEEIRGRQNWLPSCFCHYMDVLQIGLGWGFSWLPGPEAEQEDRWKALLHRRAQLSQRARLPTGLGREGLPRKHVPKMGPHGLPTAQDPDFLKELPRDQEGRRHTSGQAGQAGQAGSALLQNVLLKVCPHETCSR